MPFFQAVKTCSRKGSAASAPPPRLPCATGVIGGSPFPPPGGVLRTGEAREPGGGERPTRYGVGGRPHRGACPAPGVHTPPPKKAWPPGGGVTCEDSLAASLSVSACAPPIAAALLSAWRAWAAAGLLLPKGSSSSEDGGEKSPIAPRTASARAERRTTKATWYRGRRPFHDDHMLNYCMLVDF